MTTNPKGLGLHSIKVKRANSLRWKFYCKINDAILGCDYETKKQKKLTDAEGDECRNHLKSQPTSRQLGVGTEGNWLAEADDQHNQLQRTCSWIRNR